MTAPRLAGIASVLLVSLLVTGCASLPGVATGPSTHRFSSTPLGEAPKLTATKPQTGGPLKSPLTAATFQQITIAQGSGLDGFDSITVMADGTGYAIASDGPPGRGARVTLTFPPNFIDRLLAAARADRLTSAKGSYSSGIADGTQGFVELITTEGRVVVWLDNYFQPATNLYNLCNAVIWPTVDETLTELHSGSRESLKTEYGRVFPKDT